MLFRSFEKDTSSGGVVNTDRSAYESHKIAKSVAMRNLQQQRATQDSVQHLQDEINTLKNDLSDIKCLMVQLLQKGN